MVKPHGLHGEVVVDLLSNRPERLAPGMSLRTDDAVLAVERSRPHQGRFLVTFEGISTREDAESIRGVLLKAPPLDEPDTIWVHELIGAEVREQSGRALGRVVSVEENPASDLLVLEGGQLIPLSFVTMIEPYEFVKVDIPEGLLELD